MNEQLKILVAAELKKSTEQSINNQLKALRLNPLKLDVNISGSTATIKSEIQKATQQANSAVHSSASKINIPLNFDKNNMQNLKREFKQFADEIAKLEGYKEAKVRTTYRNSYDKYGNFESKKLSSASIDYYNESNEKALTTTYRLISGTDEAGRSFEKLSLISEKASNNIRKQNEEQQKLANTMGNHREQSESNRSVRDRNAEIAQSKAINKALEDEYQEKQKLADLIANARERSEYISKKQDTQIEVNQSKAINKALEEEYKNKIKQIEIDAKVARGKAELAKQMDIVNAKSDKAGIQLNPENQAQFESKLSTAKTINDLQEVSHHIKMADLEWKGLNATMTKDMPNTALENTNKKLLTMSPALDVLQSKFQQLGAKTPVGLDKTFDGLRQDLLDINNTPAPQEKIKKYNQLSESVVKLNAELRKLKQEQTKSKFDSSLGLDRDKLTDSITIWLNKNQRAAKAFGAELKDIQVQITNADRTQLTKLNKQFQNVQKSAGALGVTGRTVFGELKNSITKFGSWFLIGGGVASAVRSVRQIYENVVELDTAMVELRKVTEATDTQFVQFLDRAKNKSVELGSSLTDLVKATSNFSRLGYSLNEAEMLGQTATIYANVGDDVKNIDDATSSLISTMKAFDIQAGNSVSIIDKLNEVGNKSSISSGDLGSALTRSASAMAAANNTLDETIALIVAGNEVVQDADVVGTGLKTTALRIRGATADLKEMGEEIDELVSSTPKLQKELKALTGVDIMLDENTFKSTYQILQEISKVWGTLTDVSQASVLEALFGKRQANIGASIISNFDSAEKALATSLGSADSAMKEHSIWLDSVEAKQRQFTAQFQAFSDTVLNSGLIKGTFDTGTGILKFFTDLISAMGAVPALAATVAGALSFKNVGWLKMLSDNKYAHRSLSVMTNELNMKMVYLIRDYEANSLKWCV